MEHGEGYGRAGQPARELRADHRALPAARGGFEHARARERHHGVEVRTGDWLEHGDQHREPEGGREGVLKKLQADVLRREP